MCLDGLPVVVAAAPVADQHVISVALRAYILLPIPQRVVSGDNDLDPLLQGELLLQGGGFAPREGLVAEAKRVLSYFRLISSCCY